MGDTLRTLLTVPIKSSLQTITIIIFVPIGSIPQHANSFEVFSEPLAGLCRLLSNSAETDMSIRKPFQVDLRAGYLLDPQIQDEVKGMIMRGVASNWKDCAGVLSVEVPCSKLVWNL